MKLATLKDSTRDGTLIVVSRDLLRAHKADHIAPTLQAALDDWPYCGPLLEQLFNLPRHLREGGHATTSPCWPAAARRMAVAARLMAAWMR